VANASASMELIPYTHHENEYVAKEYVDYQWFKRLQNLLVDQQQELGKLFTLL
jgi:hypothetical protein